MIGRRGVLQAAGALAVLRSGVASADELLLRHGGAPTQQLATPLEYFDRAITPSRVFFVRSHFGPPALDRTRKTTFDGMVTTPLTLGVDELRTSFPEVTVTAVLQCAGNGRALQKPRVPGRAVGARRDGSGDVHRRAPEGRPHQGGHLEGRALPARLGRRCAAEADGAGVHPQPARSSARWIRARSSRTA